MQPLDALKQILKEGKVVQLATIDGTNPWLFHVWYAVDEERNAVYFTSNPIRNHSQHLTSNDAIAGGVVSMELDRLGQPVAGLTFTGKAKIVSGKELPRAYEVFTSRWPTDALDLAALEDGSSVGKIYMISVSKWILHDEVNFPTDPRHEFDHL